MTKGEYQELVEFLAGKFGCLREHREMSTRAARIGFDLPRAGSGSG